jgi:hypothetical protein
VKLLTVTDLTTVQLFAAEWHSIRWMLDTV